MNVPEQWTSQEAEDNTLTDPLGLSKLPLVEEGEDGWPVIAAALQQDRKSAHRRRLVGGWLAAAASIALAIGLVVQPGKNPSEPGGTSTLPATNGTELASQQTDATLESLIGLSQMVERQVRGLRKEIGSVPTDSLIYMAELEDLVIQVDDQLSQQPDSLDLWGQRVNLMLDLAELYRRELQRDYHMMASL
jgi:negative regulator of sigma E activity